MKEMPKKWADTNRTEWFLLCMIEEQIQKLRNIRYIFGKFNKNLGINLDVWGSPRIECGTSCVKDFPRIHSPAYYGSEEERMYIRIGLPLEGRKRKSDHDWRGFWFGPSSNQYHRPVLDHCGHPVYLAGETMTPDIENAIDEVIKIVKKLKSISPGRRKKPAPEPLFFNIDENPLDNIRDTFGGRSASPFLIDWERHTQSPRNWYGDRKVDWGSTPEFMALEPGYHGYPGN